MPPTRHGYVNVDELIAQVTPQQVAAYFGVPFPADASGEVRIPSVFAEKGKGESSYGALTINLDQPQNPIYCHVTGTRGNLLTLIHGFKHHRPPASGKLRGDEFKEATRILQQIAGKVDGVLSGQPTPAIMPPAPVSSASVLSEPRASGPVVRNISLKDSENERARALVTLHEQFVVDVAEMSAGAGAYFRSRPFLTPDVCRKWRMGYLPNSASSLLRGRVVYAYSNQQDDILSYFGRDPQFEQHWLEWEQAGRPDDKRPMKHRFVKDFHRGQELYGQNGTARLQEPHVRESLQSVGLVVVEGPNDVIRLDTLGVAAVGLCSNKVTDEQIEKLCRFARKTANGRIVLLPDNDPEGEEGFKELLWRLSQCDGIKVKLGWSNSMFDGAFAGRQPESLTFEECDVIRKRAGE